MQKIKLIIISLGVILLLGEDIYIHQESTRLERVNSDIRDKMIKYEKLVSEKEEYSEFISRGEEFNLSFSELVEKDKNLDLEISKLEQEIEKIENDIVKAS